MLTGDNSRAIRPYGTELPGQGHTGKIIHADNMIKAVESVAAIADGEIVRSVAATRCSWPLLDPTADTGLTSAIVLGPRPDCRSIAPWREASIGYAAAVRVWLHGSKGYAALSDPLRRHSAGAAFTRAKRRAWTIWAWSVLSRSVSSL